MKWLSVWKVLEIMVYTAAGIHNCNTLHVIHLLSAGPRSAVGRAPDLQVRCPGFDTLSGHILSFLLPLIQEGQLSVTGKSLCTKYG